MADAEARLKEVYVASRITPRGCERVESRPKRVVGPPASLRAALQCCFRPRRTKPCPRRRIPPPPTARSARQYEGKLAALSAISDALREENEALRAELEEAGLPRAEAGASLGGCAASLLLQRGLPGGSSRACVRAPAGGRSGCGHSCSPQLTPPIGHPLTPSPPSPPPHTHQHRNPPEEEAAELREEFARRLGENQRTIDALKVRLVGEWGRVGNAWSTVKRSKEGRQRSPGGS
jgi:hypothetical protein